MSQVALVATGGLLGSQLVVGVIALMHPVYTTLQIGPNNLTDFYKDIRGAAVAPISDLHRLQYCRLPYQCFHELCPAVDHKRSMYVFYLTLS